MVIKCNKLLFQGPYGSVSILPTCRYRLWWAYFHENGQIDTGVKTKYDPFWSFFFNVETPPPSPWKIWINFFWYNVESSLLKSWSPGVRRCHNRENHIYMCLYWKKNSPEPTGQFWTIKLGTNQPWVKGIQNYTNKGAGPLQRGDSHKNTTRGPWAASLTWVTLSLVHVEI
jgi:hypothetical protein